MEDGRLTKRIKRVEVNGPNERIGPKRDGKELKCLSEKKTWVGVYGKYIYIQART